MPNTITYSGVLDVVTCWCGVQHAIPRNLHAMAKNDPKFVVYCPLGHEWVHRTREIDELKEKLETERRSAAFWRERSQERLQELDRERRRSAALKGHLTRMRKRVAAGVCPVPKCKRSGFNDVAAHLRDKHGDWLHDHPEVLDGES